MTNEKLGPVHPGEVLLEEFMKPLGVSGYQLARETGVPPIRISEIVRGKRAISADTALRLARFFGTSERFWTNLQKKYDLKAEKGRIGEGLEEVRPLANTARNLAIARIPAPLRTLVNATDLA